MDRRTQRFPVSRGNISQFALIIAVIYGLTAFKATPQVSDFMERWILSLRRAPTTWKIKYDEIAKRALNYKLFVEKQNFGNYDPKFVIAMDETAVYCGATSQTTVTIRGEHMWLLLLAVMNHWAF